MTLASMNSLAGPIEISSWSPHGIFFVITKSGDKKLEYYIYRGTGISFFQGTTWFLFILYVVFHVISHMQSMHKLVETPSLCKMRIPLTSFHLMQILTYSAIHISIHPSIELCSKMAPGEVGVSLPWWCHALVLPHPGYWGLFLNLTIFSWWKNGRFQRNFRSKLKLWKKSNVIR